MKIYFCGPVGKWKIQTFQRWFDTEKEAVQFFYDIHWR
jgi:hypothetical protein